MSKYTTMLRFPIEQRLDELKLEHTEENWPRVYGILGLDDYPIYEEAHRSILNDKIIRTYYFREIGFETLGQFAWYMRAMMHDIMPYYNQLYPSEKFITDPMLSKNMGYTETWTRDETRNTTQDGKSDTTTKSDSTSTSHDRNVFQDTPMNGLDTGAVEGMDYATNVTFDDGSTTNASTGSNGNVNSMKRGEVGDYDGTREHTEKGFDGSQSELLLTYRKTLLNIDLEIVDRVNVLFMGLW